MKTTTRTPRIAGTCGRLIDGTAYSTSISFCVRGEWFDVGDDWRDCEIGDVVIADQCDQCGSDHYEVDTARSVRCWGRFDDDENFSEGCGQRYTLRRIWTDDQGRVYTSLPWDLRDE